MYHSVDFIVDDETTYNTWDDWHLIPSKRPSVAPPAPVTKYIDIPGFDGQVDITPDLNGSVSYGMRSGSWQFIMSPDFDDRTWSIHYSDIMNAINGRNVKIMLEDDPDYYYEGRVSVSAFESEKEWSTVTINYICMPFKRELTSSNDDWLWDEFNFEIGVIRDYSSIRVNGELDIRIVGSVVRIAPDITVDAPMTITYNNFTKEFPTAGTYHPGEFAILDGEHVMHVVGTGTITISYRGGSM